MNNWGLFFVLFIAVIYVLLILWFYLGIKKIPEFKTTNKSPQINFSIIIPFRDEVENLPTLLESITRLVYPVSHFEILLVNDDSSDDSMQLIQSYKKEYPNLPLRILQNERKSASPKKDAITTAIKQSNFEWILTTDADCILPKKWLQTYQEFIIKKNPVFIAGLVTYQQKKGFLHQFQQLDWMSLIGVTIGSFGWQKPMICSGANLGYNKQAFLDVNAFEGNNQIASGDDVFLLVKMQKAFPKQVFFLNCKEALVQTSSELTWTALFQQRVRWVAKTGAIPSFFVRFTGVVVLLINIILLFLLFGSLIYLEWSQILAVFLISKILVDTVLLVRVSIIVAQRINLFSWFLSSLWYPFFSVSVVFLGLFSSYNWKGRKFSK